MRPEPGKIFGVRIMRTLFVMQKQIVGKELLVHFHSANLSTMVGTKALTAMFIQKIKLEATAVLEPPQALQFLEHDDTEEAIQWPPQLLHQS